jgi:hypothetical protein
MSTLIMLIVFFGTAIIWWNSVAKINAAVFEGKITARYVLKHIGIAILTALAAVLVLFVTTKFIPDNTSFRF